MLTWHPVWAAICATGMKAISIPDEIRTVIICPDHDKAGIEAANTLARRMLSEHRTVKILTRDEEQRLLDCCASHLKPLVITALHTGFRSSELLSLTWNDVNFQRRVITVRSAYAKNGESRSIPMNDTLTATLKLVRLSSSEEGSQYVFPRKERLTDFTTPGTVQAIVKT